MEKVVCLFCIYVFLISDGHGQIQVNCTANYFKLKQKDYIAFKISFSTKDSTKQVIYLQNWRIAISTDNRIAGAPFSRLGNKLFLLRYDDTLENIFIGVDDSYGYLAEGILAKIDCENTFDIHLIISDIDFIERFRSGFYMLYYYFSHTDYTLFLNTMSRIPDFYTLFSKEKEKYLIIDNCDIGTELFNYNFRTNPFFNEEDESLEVLFKMNEIFNSDTIKLMVISD